MYQLPPLPDRMTLQRQLENIELQIALARRQLMFLDDTTGLSWGKRALRKTCKRALAAWGRDRDRIERLIENLATESQEEGNGTVND